MNIHKTDTAVVFIDPQNEVLSEKGLAWGLVGGSIRHADHDEGRLRTGMEQDVGGPAASPGCSIRTHDGGHLCQPVQRLLRTAVCGRSECDGATCRCDRP